MQPTARTHSQATVTAVSAPVMAFTVCASVNGHAQAIVIVAPASRSATVKPS